MADKKAERKRKAADDESSGSSDDNYTPYVPVRERKKQQLARLGRVTQLREEERRGPSKSSSENEAEKEGEDGQVNKSWFNLFVGERKSRDYFITKIVMFEHVRLKVNLTNRF